MCKYDIKLSQGINIKEIKDEEVFSKIGNLITEVTRELLKEINTIQKTIEKGEEKDERRNGKENEESNKREQSKDRDKLNRMGDTILGRRGNKAILSDSRDREKSGVIQNTLWSYVEGIHDGTRQPRDNNADNAREIKQKDVGNTRKSSRLQTRNSGAIAGQTTIFGGLGHIGEGSTFDTDIQNSGGDNNQGYNRENSITEKADN